MKSAWLHRLVIIGALVLLGLAMWQPMRGAVASLYYFPASYALNQWQKNTVRPETRQLQMAQQHIAEALVWQPQNPHYQLTAAKIAEWAWFSGLLSTAEIIKNEQIYQQAIAQRPQWPVAYADYGYFLATVQLRLTDAFAQFELAERYGPFLPEVHEKILLVAFSNWNTLPVAQKAEVFARVAAAMGGPLQTNTVRLIKLYQMERQQCIYLRKKLAASPVWPVVQGQLCPAG